VIQSRKLPPGVYFWVMRPRYGHLAAVGKRLKARCSRDEKSAPMRIRVERLKCRLPPSSSRFQPVPDSGSSWCYSMKKVFFRIFVKKWNISILKIQLFNKGTCFVFSTPYQNKPGSSRFQPVPAGSSRRLQLMLLNKKDFNRIFVKKWYVSLKICNFIDLKKNPLTLLWTWKKPRTVKIIFKVRNTKISIRE
jgi:hypothetical protein